MFGGGGEGGGGGGGGGEQKEAKINLHPAYSFELSGHPCSPKEFCGISNIFWFVLNLTYTEEQSWLKFSIIPFIIIISTLQWNVFTEKPLWGRFQWPTVGAWVILSLWHTVSIHLSYITNEMEADADVVVKGDLICFLQTSCPQIGHIAPSESQIGKSVTYDVTCTLSGGLQGTTYRGMILNPSCHN